MRFLCSSKFPKTDILNSVLSGFTTLRGDEKLFVRPNRAGELKSKAFSVEVILVKSVLPTYIIHPFRKKIKRISRFFVTCQVSSPKAQKYPISLPACNIVLPAYLVIRQPFLLQISSNSFVKHFPPQFVPVQYPPVREPLVRPATGYTSVYGFRKVDMPAGDAFLCCSYSRHIKI